MNESTLTISDINNNPALYLLVPDQLSYSQVSDLLEAHYHINAYNNLDELLVAVTSARPELILCHTSLLGGDDTVLFKLLGGEAEKRIYLLIFGPDLPIAEQVGLLKRGARGYFDESLVESNLLMALQLIERGEVWVGRHVISGLIDALSHQPQMTPEQQTAVDSLSPKEFEVAKQVSQGASNKIIARNLNITERTVKAHLTSVFQKLGFSDRLSVAIFFKDFF